MKKKIKKPILKPIESKSGTLIKFFSIFLGLSALLCPFTNSVFTSHAMHFKAAISTPIIFLFTLIWILWSAKKEKFHFSPLFLPLGMFFLWSILSMFWSTSPLDGVFVLIPWLASFAGFILMYNLIQNEKDIAFLFKMLFISGFAVAIIGVFQFIFEWKLFMQAAAPSSTFGNRNFASQYIVLVFPLGLGLLFYKDVKSSWTYFILGLFPIVFLSYTKSRATWLSFILEVSIFFTILLLRQKFILNDFSLRNFFNKTRVSKLIVGVGIITIMVNLGPNGFSWRGKEIADRVSTIGSQASIYSKTGSNRWPIWINTLAMVKDNPLLGIGVGNWIVNFHPYHGKIIKVREFGSKVYPTHLHNDLIEILSNVGIIGMALLLWFIYLVVKMQWKILKTSDRTRGALLIIAPFSAIIGIVFNSIFSFPFFNYLPLAILLVYCAVISHLACKDSEENENTKGVILSNKIRISSATILAVITIFTTVYGYKIVKGEFNYYYGRALLERGIAKKQNKSTKRAWQLFLNHCNTQLDLNPVYYHPYQTKFFFNCAVGYKKIGNFRKSIDLIEYALSIRPYDMFLQGLLFQVFFDSKSFAKAKEVAHNLIKDFPNYPQGHAALGRIYEKTGLKKAARELYKKANELKN